MKMIENYRVSSFFLFGIRLTSSRRSLYPVTIYSIDNAIKCKYFVDIQIYRKVNDNANSNPTIIVKTANKQFEKL